MGRMSLKQTLRRRLESCAESKHSSVDEIVNHLRSKYPDYGRQKRQTLALHVREAMNSRSNSIHDDDDEEQENNRSASRKKMKRNDESEERLQRIEALHIQSRMRTDQFHIPQSSASSSSSESDDEEEDGSVSTSEDAIYGEKFEPAVDLMKTMLRNSYKNEEKNNNVDVELEVASSSKTTTAIANDGDEGQAHKLAMKRRHSNNGDEGKAHKLNNGGSGVEEVKGKKEGPWFKDLGGMKQVLEELKMEVIVPLCHPQVPRQLGVRPMAGILLYGPPGCGKTKLAHAIANETSLPFYQISATELVSGVSG